MFAIIYAIFVFIIVANCGHPDLLLWSVRNDSVPSIEAYDDLPIEGSTIMFSCPNGLKLVGGPSNLATCTSGEWEPDPSDLMCNGKLLILTSIIA